MNLVFVLPKVSRYPVGGYKIVFEYANRLCAKGHNITLVFLNQDFMSKYPIPASVRKRIATHFVYKEPRWFELDRRIKKVSKFINDSSEIDYSSIGIATAAQTAEFVNKYFKAKSTYFIQGYEDWGTNIEKLHQTYSLPMNKIAIASWLKKKVDEYSDSPCEVIQNPIDNKIYQNRIKLENRKRHSIALLYNELPTKGFEYAYEAIQRIKKTYPDIEVNMFGRFKYPGQLPDWIHYTCNASQLETVEIYNKSRVFLCASIEEGYGLTCLEAMACGCVLVTTDYSGVKEFANENNAFLSPIKSVSGLVNNIKKAFEDNDKCQRIISNAYNIVSKYSWEDAVLRFESVVMRGNE